MRSAFFQKPFEYQILTVEEEWNQGDTLAGTLKVRNSGPEPTLLKGIKLILAYGIRKEVKTGNPEAWTVLDEKLLLQEQKLESQAEENTGWSFRLPSDCPVTEKNASLFLLFGGEDALREGGRIDLRISLHPILQSFLQTFTTQFKFLEKYRKGKGEWTEIKLIPPDSKEFPNLDHLLCLLRIRDEVLEACFRFKMKSFGRDAEKVKVVSKKREHEMQMNPSEYLQPGGFPNRSQFRDKILEALNIAKLKAL